MLPEHPARKGLTNKHHSRPPADLYLCYGECGQWKPAGKFQRSNNKSGRVYTWICQVCSKARICRKNKKFWAEVKNNPKRQLELLDQLGPEPIPKIDGWDKYNKYKMARSSLLVRLGLKDKNPPFDIVKCTMYKVKYGRLSIEDADRIIEDYYIRHPESRPTD